MPKASFFDQLVCPKLAVDLIIEMEGKIVLINRRNAPYGWALPGGFVEYGESLEAAAAREAKEETSLDIEIVHQFHTYSEPKRDTRGHVVACVYVAKAKGRLQAGDDAKGASLFSLEDLPESLCFDHGKILADYRTKKY